MILVLLIVVPVAGALAAFGLRAASVRRGILAAVALTHAGLTIAAWRHGPQTAGDGWLVLDTLGLLFLSITSALFLATTVYAIRYLPSESRVHQDWTEGFFFVNEPEAIFTGCLLLFLASMTLVTLSQHFGLLWVAVEATTLASAPLIYFHRHHRSLEATWKYLLICSVGIALALLGNFLLAVAASHGGSAPTALTVADLVRSAARLHVPWVEAAFLFFLVGYGTKMGLAPLHTWLPDAHSESPSVVSALLSGALLNCAFLAILRIHQVCVAAGLGDFSRQLLVGFWLFSIVVAAVFILGQSDFKRMLAYSSVEHMGILALSVGCGAGYAMGLHAIGHSLVKGSLFLTSGILLAAYKTKNVTKISGLLPDYPATGLLWLVGFLAIVGAPPFSLFMSEFLVAKALIDGSRPFAATAFLVLLGVILIGMASSVLPMLHGRANDNHDAH